MVYGHSPIWGLELETRTMGLGIAGIFDVLRVSVVTTDIFLAPFCFVAVFLSPRWNCLFLGLA